MVLPSQYLDWKGEGEIEVTAIYPLISKSFPEIVPTIQSCHLHALHRDDRNDSAMNEKRRIGATQPTVAVALPLVHTR